MIEQNVILDVRSAKEWVDSQNRTLEQLGERLKVIEHAYLKRSGEYASVPSQRPDSVQAEIDTARDEPGRELLTDARTSRPE